MSEPEADRIRPPQLDAALATIQTTALDSSCTYTEFEDRRAGLRALIAVDLALAARRRNTALSLQSRVPDELWCLVWRDLPLADRLSVTCVCHTWRAIARGSPYLWRFLGVVVDIHNAECDCQQCVEDNRKSRTMMLGGRGRPSKTNVRLVERALQLGRQTPVVLQLTDESRFTYDDAYSLLGKMLAPHAHRIRAIYLRMLDNEIIDLIFDAIQSFPVLRVLHMVGGDDPRRLNMFASNPLVAPLLEELVMTNNISWVAAISKDAQFAKLHTLCCPIWSAQDALQLLRVCAGPLRRVKFDVTSIKDGEAGLVPADLDKARLLAGRIPDVTLYGLKPTIEAPYLDIFAIPEIKSLSLWYYKFNSPSLRAVQNLASHCVGDSVTCACAAVDHYTAFKIDVGPLKHRLVMQSANRESRQQTWQILVAEIATELIIDFNLWLLILEDDNVKPMAHVTMFSVLLWTADDVAAFLTSQSVRLDLFPGLHDIRSHEQVAPLITSAKHFISVYDTPKARRNGRSHLGYYMIDVDGEKDSTKAVRSIDFKPVVVPLD